MKADVFYRTFNRVRERARVIPVEVDVPDDASLHEIIAEAGKKCGRSLLARSGATGVFEVQTDRGIWSAPNEGCVLTKACTFCSWEELEGGQR